VPIKDDLRRAALARRDREDDRTGKSAAIARRVLALPAYRRASSVLFYVGVRSEVETIPLIEDALDAGKRAAVVFVDRERLGCAWISSLDDLAPAPFGLREPPPEMRDQPNRRCRTDDIDLVLVPGVAFDRAGGRLGYGRGYYDRLLATVRPDAAIVALAFECQLVASVPMRPRDVHVPTIVTEAAVYRAAAPR